ncbi:MAG: HemK2/MTQ2 family protein methyltransferase [Halobacteria archaeon]|nr:HemK2/MTQ2 family protein methyltransferase [Halobacteria archaeon]
MTDHKVYPPSEDTYLLLDAALEEVKDSDKILEVGTGSGVVAEELREKAKRVVATDINPYAVKEAREKGLDVVRTNLCDAVCGKFDLVIFNPPYLPADEDRDDWMNRALEGGETGREVVEEFLGDVERVLTDDNDNNEGRILLVVSSLTEIEEVEKTARAKGYSTERVAEDRYFFEEIVVLRLGLRPDSD